METQVELNATLMAPIARGDQVGTVRLTQAGETVFEAPVVALASVEQAGFFARIWDSIRLWFSQLFSVEG